MMSDKLIISFGQKSKLISGFCKIMHYVDWQQFLRREKLSISVLFNDVGRGTVVCVKRFIGCMKEGKLLHGFCDRWRERESSALSIINIEPLCYGFFSRYF